ncbi:MAG: acyl-ACP--UDP-N-acetylglucosamine O-acyltransferase [Deltaproteobacteria bacterium]|nr:acyl-ACP--UDP-N-acetylglucosamine O-acyltransferase [Deltaproteobacteria bacterium]
MIHPTAVVDPAAEVDPTASIGPYVVIEGPVRVGPECRVMAHAVLRGSTCLGARNVVHPGAVLGGEPQDLAFGGAESSLVIGDDNVFREHLTVHRGTSPGSATVVGSGNYFMQSAHVAHNCRVGDGTIVAGGALLAGHVELADRAFVSGNCVVHQHVRIGRLALLRGLSRTSRDVPPFCLMDGTHTVRGVNVVGLRRAGFEPARVAVIRRAFARLFGRPTHLGRALDEVEAGATTDEVRELLAFIRASKRGVCVASRARGSTSVVED